MLEENILSDRTPDGVPDKSRVSHAVVAGVVGPHRCEYLTEGAEVFLDQLLLAGIPLRIEKSGMDALGENLEERNGIFNEFGVRGDFHPAEEASPLAPGGGAFLESGRREALGYCLLCSIVVS